MNLEVAQPQNNEELLEFYRSFPLDGLIHLRLDRSQDFFKYYGLQSDQYLTYILRSSNRIMGVVSFIIDHVVIEGKLTTIAWARDLRIAHDRMAILGWAEHTQFVFEEIKKIFKVEHFFSTLNLSEEKPLNTFIRPRSQKRALPKYHLYRKFQLVSAHGFYPWARQTWPQLKIRRGNEKNQDALLEYLVKSSQNYSFHSAVSKDLLLEKLDRWIGFDWNDFIIAYDRKDNIVGTLSSWSSAGIQDFIPLRYSFRAHNFRQFLKFAHLLGWSRTLTKPYHRIKIESSLNFRLLNYIRVDHPDVFSSLMTSAYHESKENEFLLYFRDQKNIQLKAPRGWISAEQTYGLFCPVLPNEQTPDFLHPKYDGFADIETTRII